MSYADDTEYAARNLIDLAAHEEVELKTTLASLKSAEARRKMSDWDYSTSDLNDDFSEAYVMAAFIRAAQASQEADAFRSDIDRLQASIGARQVAVQAIWGALFQLAKQGISLVHGGRTNAPPGRLIATLPLRDIVWQARNQALHYEEGSFRPEVIQVFAALEASHGQLFSLTARTKQSRAKQVATLLDWQTYSQYLTDARSLGL